MASHVRTLYRVVPAAALAFSLASVITTPARATDDGYQNFFSAVLGMFGVGGNNNDAPIDYNQQPPLVVPPTMNLPKPRPPVTSEAKDWPRDADVLRAEKAAEGAKAPRVDPDFDHNPAAAAEASRRRGTPIAHASTIPSGDCLDTHQCNPAPFWNLLKNTKAQQDKKVQLIPGQEPAREYLTQPPPGYMVPTKAVKVTAQTPKSQDDASDNSAEYFRQQKERQLYGQ